MEIFGIPLQAFMGQLMLGLVNGAFYAMLSLGLAVIFGLLGIVNFAHGALYMLGAFAAWIMLDQFGLNYWFALVLAPLIGRHPGGHHRTAFPQAPVQARPACTACC
jgi:branched-chain amino acid transport system permease protein